jgi:hypothetical protein
MEICQKNKKLCSSAGVSRTRGDAGGKKMLNGILPFGYFGIHGTHRQAPG